MFATVGSNRVTVYECREAGYIKLIAAYADSDVSFDSTWHQNKNKQLYFFYVSCVNIV